MPFVRRKRGQVLLLQSFRSPEDGCVGQRVIHRFASAGELASALGCWKAWAETLEWRHPGMTFDWQHLERELRTELRTWQRTPAGAAPRRANRVRQLAGDLDRALRTLSPTDPTGTAVLTEARTQLATLRDTLNRLLAPALRTAKERPMEPTTAGTPADDIFEKGMEHWHEGNQATACQHFRRALKLDPAHADAHNHLGIVAMERGRLAEAERHFRLAIAGGSHDLVRRGKRITWDHFENRPYLRGLANLALALRRQNRHAEALAIHEQMITLDPDASLGAYFFRGEEMHRLGNLNGALKAYRAALVEPGCSFGLALVLVETDAPASPVGHALLRAFASNRYVAPMLLGEPWKRLDGSHATNMAEPEWASDYVQESGDLWRRTPGSAEVLRHWWQAGPVRAWRDRLDHFMVRLQHMPGCDERVAVFREGEALRTDEQIAGVVARVLVQAS